MLYLIVTLAVMTGALFLAIERHRRAVLALNRTLTNAALANLNADLAATGGGMHFTRLSDRARGGGHGEETARQEEGRRQAASAAEA